MDTDVTASIEYAIDHLSTKLILVMGHTSCGAASGSSERRTIATTPFTHSRPA
ncbi:hypothetical protein N8668_00320 [bacterium]|nr:hypothetical protein [bacterium]MDA7660074.1 hypothetical protein [Verrucomicrobiota bacterium]MDA7652703.1 hypothetical protein [bacterium]MDB4663494.1 hypothetical protein [Verrucomicrobiota bacterium]MDB4689383.1 hypothetical protein [Verrucomicrobiota bacterium]